jgi:hypothetical protein
VVRVVAAPLVSQQAVRTHDVLIRPDAALDGVGGQDRQRRRELARLADALHRIDELERAAIDLEILQQLVTMDRRLPVVRPHREPRLRLPPQPGVEVVAHGAGP